MKIKTYLQRNGKDLYIKLTKSKGRMKYEHKCNHCCNDFISNRLTAKYCSDNCRIYAYKKRKAEESLLDTKESVKRRIKRRHEYEVLNSIVTIK